MAVVFVGLIVNLRGVRGVSWLAGVSFALMLVPFAVSLSVQAPAVVRGLPHLLASAPRIEWAGFLSTVLWGYTGWASLGALAGEVRNPAVTYPRGTALTMVFVSLLYGLPLLTSATTHPDYWNWRSGSFLRHLEDAGEWVAVLAALTAVLSQVSTFTAGLATSTRTMCALAGGGATDAGAAAGGGGGAPRPLGISPPLHAAIMGMSVAHLRTLLQRAGVSYADCVEKRELQARVVQTVVRGQAPG